MAVYKVPQDVEAEDKFLGPLTFKQFLFGGGVIITGYIMFLMVTRGAAIFTIIILPFFLAFLALAFPWGKDQPTEIWLAGRFRYMFFPRKRIWDQSGAKDLVTITVPKREEHIYSDGLEEDEVKSRFDALASVVDSRGWAIKNIVEAQKQTTDRLAGGSVIDPPVKDTSSIAHAKDVYDNVSSPLPNQFESMIQESETTRRQATLDMVDEALQSQQGQSLPQVPTASTVQPAAQPANRWFDHQTATAPVDPDLAQLQQAQQEYAATTQQTTAAAPQPTQATTAPQTPNTPSEPPVDPGILALAHNDDLSVETIARQVNKSDDDTEVVINLR